MNQIPENRELIDRLSSEYVLGTLRGAARRRLERWRNASPQVDERCRFWEEKLMPLLSQIQPVQPPSRVWDGIRARLQLSESPPHRRPLRTWALAASVVAIVGVAAMLYWQTTERQRVAEVATITTASGSGLWHVEFYGKPEAVMTIQVRADKSARAPSERDYELWALPKGGAPVSLGVLPYQAHSIRRALTAAQQQALGNAAQLAVSVEPVGGSPTGQPTGAVVYVAPLRAS